MMRSKEEIEKRIAQLQDEVDMWLDDGAGGQSAMYNDSFTQADSELDGLKWVLGMEREDIFKDKLVLDE
tara:strand:- start:64 stop:270 length:207 start_codon:yes stop_codon:yes gene_type:complete